MLARLKVATLLSRPGHRRIRLGRGQRASRPACCARSLSEAILVLRRLHGEVIGNARCRIGPEIRRHLLRRAQADIEIGGDGVGVEAELRRAGAVDLGEEGRRIDLLLQMRIGDARDRRDALAQFLGDAQIVGAVIADGAHVDLRRQAEIEDLRDDVGGLEVEGHFGERGRQHLRAACAHSRRSARGPPSATPG